MKNNKIYSLADEVINHRTEVVDIINSITDSEVQDSFYDILKRHMFVRKNIEFIKYLGNQKTMDCQREMLSALLNMEVRGNDYALYVISNQEKWGLQQQIRLLAEEEYVSNDLIKLMINQYTWEDMNSLRRAMDKDYIRLNKYFIETIAKQKDYEAKEALITALSHSIIRENKSYFDLVVSQGYYLCMLEMLDAILNKDLRDNYNLLMIIDSYKTECMLQEQARLNLSIKAIRENLVDFYKIMKCNISIQEKIRSAYNSNIQFDLDELISDFSKRLTNR